MERISVSACIITFNQENYIRQCLDGAVSQQTDFDYEIVIGEDCSTDGTLKICQEYADKYPNLIRLISRKSNLGMAQNWIDTLQSCNGKYVALCEGDDYWTDPLKLQKQVGFLENNPDYVMCFHQVEILNNENKIIRDFLTNVPEHYETIETLARQGNYIHTPSVVFRNVVTDFPYEFTLSPIVDYFLYLMLAEHGKLKYLEEKMCVYRHGVGVFSGESLLNIIKNNLKLFACLFSYCQEPIVKGILYERYLKAMESLGKSIDSQYDAYFISGHVFFRTLKYVGKNASQPSKIIRKAVHKIFKTGPSSKNKK